ncbi:hypothetical protein GPECTOR_2g1210 [Gonium pectorale]|uniref:Uncharacterized protein n=1 Tax=Gonium pectorale TaxID=33097 RepID=A0A150H252_GONPE|nr:hypothetical protein GPECTOR_2g1210 [Gonium pectorale]|eukprot:KXZ55660.1 hypothetical protein GPECTOR_2g1210 [Gonium pectorale]
MLSTFTKCMPVEPHVKGIANLNFTSLGPNAHTFTYHAGKSGVRPGDGATVVGTHEIANPLDTPLVVYHYNGAASEWHDRVRRHAGGVSGLSTKKSIQYEIIDRESNLDCLAGREVALRMRRRLRSAAAPAP